MYSRSFYPTEEGYQSPPENYDGTAFPDLSASAAAPIEIGGSPEEKNEAVSECASSVTNEKTESVGLFNLPILSNLFSSKGKGVSSLFSDIGMEEILIMAVAAFLLFSKDGDLECAIMLLLLLFVK